VGAEGGHEAVTLPLADTGPVAAEDPADDLVEAVQELLHGLPVELALQLGGVDNVAEDDRDDPEFLRRATGTQAGPALLTEFGGVVQAVPAVGTCPHRFEYMGVRSGASPTVVVPTPQTATP
jgi:hypothetical protein